MSNLTFSSIKPNQIVWIANPHCGGSIRKYKTISSPYLGKPNCEYYCFDVSYFNSMYKNDINTKVFFNEGGFIKMFYNETDAKVYLENILSDDLFVKYDKIRLKEHNLSRKSGRFISHSNEHKYLKKLLIDLYKPQEYNLPEAA